MRSDEYCVQHSSLRLSFHANHLFNLRDDFHQVGLISHNLVDVFIRAGNFVHDACVFAAFDARSLAFQIFAREAFFRRRAREFSARAVRAGIVAFRRAQTFDDKRFRAHRAGNDAEATEFGVDCAFARNENLLAEMRFRGDVIVMTVDRNFRSKRDAFIEHFVK